MAPTKKNKNNEIKNAESMNKIKNRNFITKPPSPRRAKYTDRTVHLLNDFPKKNEKINIDVFLTKELFENYSSVGKTPYLVLKTIENGEIEISVVEAKKTSSYVASFMSNRESSVFGFFFKNNNYFCFLIDEDDDENVLDTMLEFVNDNYGIKATLYDPASLSKVENVINLVDGVFQNHNLNYENEFKHKKTNKDKKIYPISSIINIAENLSKGGVQNVKIVGIKQAKEGAVTIEDIMSVDDAHGYKYMKKQKYFIKGTRKNFNNLKSFVKVLEGKIYIPKEYSKNNVISERVKSEILEDVLKATDKNFINRVYNEFLQNASQISEVSSRGEKNIQKE